MANEIDSKKTVVNGPIIQIEFVFGYCASIRPEWNETGKKKLGKRRRGTWKWRTHSHGHDGPTIQFGPRFPFH